MAEQTRIARVPGEGIGVGRERRLVVAKVRQPPPEPDPCVRVIRVSHERRVGAIELGPLDAADGIGRGHRDQAVAEE
jgi:hypothetical protein